MRRCDKEVDELCKKLGFPVGTPKGSLAEGKKIEHVKKTLAKQGEYSKAGILVRLSSGAREDEII